MTDVPCGDDTCIDIKERDYLRSRNATLQAVEKWLADELANSRDRDSYISGYRSALLQLRDVINEARP
jgi:hypothetical protein